MKVYLEYFKYIINTKTVLIYTVFVILSVLFFYSNLYRVINNVYNNTYEQYITRLDIITTTEGLDINLMCNTIGCEYVIANNITYINNNGILFETNSTINTAIFYKYFTYDIKTILNYKDIVFIVDDSKYILLIYQLINVMLFLFITIISIGYIIFLLNRYKASLIEKNNYKHELESRLQRDLTESLHHEMGMPIAIIDTLVTDVYSSLYPCYSTSDGVCDFTKETVDIANCMDCKLLHLKRQSDIVAIDNYQKIKFAISRLNAVLNLIAGSKHIKYNNGTVSLYNIIDNIVSSVNSYRVNKIHITIVDENILHKYATGLGLSNGDMLNIINIMVNNSVEAKSTVIIFEPIVVNDYQLELYISDNGRGIRDKFDNIIQTENIFRYGYSTKDIDGNNIIETSIFKKILYKLGFYIHKITFSQRGAGLSINKSLLVKSGGDINLVNTSVNGTKFRLLLPIKLKR